MRQYRRLGFSAWRSLWLAFWDLPLIGGYVKVSDSAGRPDHA